jgi:hypothetical protein
VGSGRHGEQRLGYVLLRVRGVIEAFTVYPDIDEAGAVAERLAGSGE